MIKAITYVDLHLLVEVVLHDETVRQTNTMRLHGVTSHIGIVSNVGIVEIGHLLGRGPIEGRRAECRGVRVAHIGRSSVMRCVDFASSSRKTGPIGLERQELVLFHFKYVGFDGE
jgi:hypothetical protein